MKVPSLCLTLPFLLLAACTGSDAPPTPKGPFMVFVGVSYNADDSGAPKTVLVTYDTETRREYTRTTIQSLVAPQLSQARGEVIGARYLYGAPGTIVRVDPFTGEEHNVLDVPELISSPRLSPDGQSIAYILPAADGGQEPLVDIFIARLPNGQRDLLATVPRKQKGANAGPLTVNAWQDDGAAIVLNGSTIGNEGRWSRVSIPEGEVTTYPVSLASVSPNGRLLLTDGVNMVGCILDQPQHVKLYDLETRSFVADYEDPNRGSYPFEWSPDGESVLLRQYPALSTPPGDCVPEYDFDDPHYGLLSRDGFSAVSDVDALRLEWHGDRLIEYHCEKDDKAAGRWSFEDCRERGRQVLRLNGIEVSRADEIHVLGFIESTR